jgi:folate-binding Fe-S cluster repair protein YgfZ
MHRARSLRRGGIPRALAAIRARDSSGRIAVHETAGGMNGEAAATAGVLTAAAETAAIITDTIAGITKADMRRIGVHS